MKVKEFLTISEEDDVYEILEDDQIITELWILLNQIEMVLKI